MGRWRMKEGRVIIENGRVFSSCFIKPVAGIHELIYFGGKSSVKNVKA